MKKKGFWNWLSIFETSLSAAEGAWRIVTLIVILGGGTMTAFVAKAGPILKGLGPVYWIGVGIVTALVFSIILLLIKSSGLKKAQANLYKAMAVPKSKINPLADSFTDAVIPVEDLRLPTFQAHENKLFKRCRFVGPAALGISGGRYVRNHFREIGDIIVVPTGSITTGVVVFINCTVEDCEFLKITILADENTAGGFARDGASVKGLRI